MGVSIDQERPLSICFIGSDKDPWKRSLLSRYFLSIFCLHDSFKLWERKKIGKFGTRIHQYAINNSKEKQRTESPHLEKYQTKFLRKSERKVFYKRVNWNKREE